MECALLQRRSARKVLYNLNINKISYSSKISFQEKITMPHSNKLMTILKECKEIERVEFNDNKKRNSLIKFYKLTEKGKRVVQLLLQIEEELKK